MSTTATSIRMSNVPRGMLQTVHDFFKAIQLLLLADRIETAERMLLR